MRFYQARHGRSLLVGGVVVALACATAIAAPADAQPTTVRSTPRAITIADIADQVPAVAAYAGFSDKLVLWSVSGGKIRIGLTDTSPGIAQVFRARFGPNTIIYHQDPLYSEQRITPAPKNLRVVRGGVAASNRAVATTTPTRLQDSQPYFGGDRIVRTYTQGTQTYIVQCTVTTPMLTNSNGSQAMLTAGHCGPTGTVWDQGYYPGTGSVIYITGTMGTDTVTQWGNGRVDGELLQGATYGYDPDVYISMTGSDAVDGAGATAGGGTFCSDGSFTGYSCGAVVTSTGYNVCANISDNGTTVNVCHLDIANANHRIVQPGDSGGPVLYPEPRSPGHVLVVGTVSAGNSSGTQLLFSDVGYLESGLAAQIW